jgi:uncharacterized protein (TIGR03435 family)
MTIFVGAACLVAFGQMRDQQREGDGSRQRGREAGAPKIADLAPGQAEKSPAFDAVSVKPLGAAAGGLTSFGLRYSPGHITGNEQIPNLIMRAYSVKRNQLVLPDNVDILVNRYQIDAVMPAGTTSVETDLMLRSMLVERFGLRFHRETRDVAVYALTAGKKVKLEAVDAEGLKDRVFETPIGPRKGCSGSSSRSGSYTAHCATIYEFALAVGRHLDRPVIDQTGLPGTYDIDLQWDPKDQQDLISTIQSRLGLTLEQRRMPFEMFVVDQISVTPSSN